jgi:dihydropyrimidinase
VSARPFDLVVRGGRVVDRDRDEAADVGVVDGRVAAVGPGLEGRRVVDATGMLVIPGAVDGHVHIRTERDQDAYDDTFATGSVAAAFGGVTTFLDQVQVEPGRGLTPASPRRRASASSTTASTSTRASRGGTSSPRFPSLRGRASPRSSSS